MDLKTFFSEEEVPIFAWVDITDLPDPDRKSVVQVLPSARSVIVFGKEVPVRVYRAIPGEKTRIMLQIAEELDSTAHRLARFLNKEESSAISVPLYLPVRIQDGRVKGVVSLKPVAEAGKLGSIGRNSLLLSPWYGPRLLLSGVVTSIPVSELYHGNGTPIRTGTPDSGLCTGCGHCIKVCPGGAFGPEGVDAFRCRTVRPWIAPSLVPFVKWMLGRQMLLKCAAPLAPWIARIATIRCSLCVTECPLFEGIRGNDQSAEGEI